MERNVGGLDRTARLVGGPVAAVVGLAILLGVVSTSPLLGAGLLVVGAVLSVTGFTQKCPAHVVLGIDTCPRN